MDLKRQEALFEVGQGRKIVRGKDLDREVDLHLIEPTGVVGSVDEDGIGPLGTEAVGGFLAPMSGAVVPDPEDATCGLVGFLAHDFTDETIHRRNTILELATTEYLGAVDIPSRQIDPSALTKVLVLNSHWAVRRGRQSRLFTTASLNARLFIGRDHKIVSAQRNAFPKTVVQVEDRTSLGSKMGITRKDPAEIETGERGSGRRPKRSPKPRPVQGLAAKSPRQYLLVRQSSSSGG